MPTPRTKLPILLRDTVLPCVIAAVTISPRPGLAQGATLHGGTQAVPLVTRATPTAGRQHFTEAYLSQAAVHGMATFAAGRLEAMGMLNLEGLTIARGELTTGAYGEGFYDRRHPHTYLHEVIVSARTSATAVNAASISIGRGFATFGSDDPMVRPLVKYPVNHHLAQILERGIVAGAARYGPLLLEASTFNGDEPTAPGDLPRFSRIGDSWAARATWIPLAPLELSASHARVTSPEVRDGGGVDQVKWHAGARWASGARYLFAEWARTMNQEDHAAGEHFDSFLAEGELARGPLRMALRLEQTDRHEDERLEDPFRAAVPPHHVSVLAVTRWRVVTISASRRLNLWDRLRVAPFVEGSIADVAPRGRSVFDVERFYGSRTLGMVSIGARLDAGTRHDRMGRYGVALPVAPHHGAHH